LNELEKRRPSELTAPTVTEPPPGLEMEKGGGGGEAVGVPVDPAVAKMA